MDYARKTSFGSTPEVPHGSARRNEISDFRGADEARDFTEEQILAERRLNGTARETASTRFERDEQATLCPSTIRACLPAAAADPSRRARRHGRSPTPFARESRIAVRNWVDVVVALETVRIFHDAPVVTHAIV
jgi:hypothetical protein